MLTHKQHDMLATMVSVMTEQDENCRWVDFKNSRRTRICNIAHRALVAVPMKDGKSDPYTVFIATFKPDDKFEEDGLHCNEPLRKRVYDFFHTSAKHKFMKATSNFPKGYMDAHVKCQEDEEC